MVIKNYAAICEELTDRLVQLAKDLNPYDTDIYLYYDEKTKTARLYNFTEVGLYSYGLDDDHITICSDDCSNELHTKHFAMVFEHYQSIQKLVEQIGISEEQLLKETLDYYEGDITATEYGYINARYYIKNKPEYMDKLKKGIGYYDYIDIHRPDYVEKASSIMEETTEYYKWFISDSEAFDCCPLVLQVSASDDDINRLNQFVEKLTDEKPMSYSEIKEQLIDEGVLEAAQYFYGGYAVNGENLSKAIEELNNSEPIISAEADRKI